MVVAPPNEWPIMAAFLTSSLPCENEVSLNIIMLRCISTALTISSHLKLFKVEVSIHHIIDI